MHSFSEPVLDSFLHPKMMEKWCQEGLKLVILASKLAHVSALGTQVGLLSGSLR